MSPVEMGRTGPVRPEHAFDEERLRAYLLERLPEAAGSMAVSQFDSGQSNPTYVLRFPDRELVLRKKPPGELLASAHAVDREYRVMRALAETDVPVPACHCLCEDETVIGTAFFVMDRVPGRVLRNPALPDVPRDERRATAEDVTRALARLHRADWRALGLEDFGRHAGYVGRQIRRWSKQYAATVTEPIPHMDELSAWVVAHNPEDPDDTSDTTLVHGDYRLDNAILHPERPVVSAVIDWELATLGNPLSDLAYYLMLYEFPNDDSVFPGLAGVDLAEEGLPGADEHMELYARERGVALDQGLMDYYLAYSMFRMAAILQGVYARGLQGNASATNALDMGPLAVEFARLGWHRAQTARLQ